MWSWCLDAGHTRDDQVAVTHYMDAFPDRVRLDTQNLFVWNDYIGTVADIESGEPIRFRGRHEPYFIHFPSPPAFMMTSSGFHFRAKGISQQYVRVARALLGEEAALDQPVERCRVTLSYMVILYAFLVVVVILFLILMILLSRPAARRAGSLRARAA